MCTNAERIAGAVAAWLLAREAGVLAQQVGLGFAQRAASGAAAVAAVASAQRNYETNGAP